MPDVRAIGDRSDNAALILDLRALGYLRDDDRILDPTYGEGRFWRRWHPARLVATDLDPALSPTLNESVDFTALPFADLDFDAVVFDPPYKLNGRPGRGGPATSDAGYGVGGDRVTSWQDRHLLIGSGIVECARVCRRTLIVKCMDQVSSGAVRWQTREFADLAESRGFRLVDMLHVRGYRAQPLTMLCRRCGGEGVVPETDGDYEGAGVHDIDCPRCGGTGTLARPQVHARRDYSTALVLRRLR